MDVAAMAYRCQRCRKSTWCRSKVCRCCTGGTARGKANCKVPRRRVRSKQHSDHVELVYALQRTKFQRLEARGQPWTAIQKGLAEELPVILKIVKDHAAANSILATAYALVNALKANSQTLPGASPTALVGLISVAMSLCAGLAYADECSAQYRRAKQVTVAQATAAVCSLTNFIGACEDIHILGA